MFMRTFAGDRRCLWTRGLRHAPLKLGFAVCLLLWNVGLAMAQLGQMPTTNLCGSSESDAKGRILVGRVFVSGDFEGNQSRAVEAVFLGTILNALLVDKNLPASAYLWTRDPAAFRQLGNSLSLIEQAFGSEPISASAPESGRIWCSFGSQQM